MIPIKECYQLSEDVLVLIHMQTILAAKVQNQVAEIGVKVLVAALTAFLTAITTTSCMGHGPITF